MTEMRIPGGELIGMGIDLFQSSLPDAKLLLRVIDFDWSNLVEYPVPNTDLVYLYPQDMGFTTSGGQAGEAYATVFARKSRQEIRSDVMARLEIGGEYRGVVNTASGFLDAEIDRTASGKTNAEFAIVDCESNLYELFTKNSGAAPGRPKFGTINPDLQAAFEALEASVTPDNLESFMRFFDKWGAFYLDQTLLGGRFINVVAVSATETLDVAHLQIDVGYEFSSTFADAHMDEEYKKDDTYEEYHKERSHAVKALGGSHPEAIQAINIGYEDGSKVLADWLSSLWAVPKMMGQQLQCIWTLCENTDKQRAVQGAFLPYIQRHTREFSLNFSGSGFVALRGTFDIIDDKTDFTVECWFRCAKYPDKDSPATPLISQYVNIEPADKDAVVFVGVDDEGRLITFMGDGDTRVALATTDLKGSNAWHHAAVAVHTRDNGRDFKLYLDGQLADSKQSFCPVRSGDADISVGGNGQAFFEGHVDEVRVWACERPHHDIAKHMDCRLSGLEEGLVGYWPMNEGNWSATDREMQVKTFDYSWSGDRHTGILSGDTPPSWDADDVPPSLRKLVAVEG